MGISENRGNKDVNSGYDRGECCLSAVFFVLFTCWHVQFWRIFALFFPINKLLFIERFHSRDHHLCKFIGTKESICIRKEINSHRTGLRNQHGRCFIVLGHQYGRLDVMWKHSIDVENRRYLKIYSLQFEEIRQNSCQYRSSSLKTLKLSFFRHIQISHNNYFVSNFKNCL